MVMSACKTGFRRATEDTALSINKRISEVNLKKGVKSTIGKEMVKSIVGDEFMT